MKKILSMLGIGLLLASCTDDYTDWTNPAQNAQDDAKNVTLTVSSAAAIDFATLTEDSVQLFVPSVTVEDEAETTYTVTLINGDDSATLNADAEGKVASEELQLAVEILYGKRPVARTIPLSVIGLTTVGEQTIKNEATTTATVTLEAPFIANAYYLVGDMLGWDATESTKFSHSGADVYEDPVFTFVFTTTAADQYWKIIPQTCLDAGGTWAIENAYNGVVGVEVDGDDSLEGKLITTTSTGAKANAGKIAKPGIYRMTINMMEYSYKIEELNFAENIYLVGMVNGTSWNTSFPLYGENFDGNYAGFYYINGGFKFKPNADNWNDDFGQDPNAETGRLITENEQDCNTSEGFYVVNVNTAAMTYSLTKIEFIDIVGGVEGGASDWSAGPHMTYNQTKQCWEADVTLTGAFKFRGNGSWDNADGNFGGTTDKIVNGSNDNVEPTVTGPVHVELYLGNNSNSYATITAK